MPKVSKNNKNVRAEIDNLRAYNIDEAAALLKKVKFAKFDESVELHCRLGVDPRQANQMVRGVATLPHGTGKEVRVLVLTTPDKEAEATEAGADFVGLDDLIDLLRK